MTTDQYETLLWFAGIIEAFVIFSAVMLAGCFIALLKLINKHYDCQTD